MDKVGYYCLLLQTSLLISGICFRQEYISSYRGPTISKVNHVSLRNKKISKRNRNQVTHPVVYHLFHERRL